MQYENGKHKSASESDIQEVLSKQGQSVLHITYLTWVSLGQFSPRLLTERVTMLLFFIPIAAATPLPRSKLIQLLKGQRCSGNRCSVLRLKNLLNENQDTFVDVFSKS